MASEEVKAMLDALMGADRNAPLPKGAAVPVKSKNNNNKRSRESTGGGGLVLPGKRHKSCYDKDIDPLFTAWGVDVYDLFINTKSDLGTNPYIVDEGAFHEYRKLPVPEQERLGYHYFLFQKLSELVRQCDRTVNRNKEKLKQELNRKLSQRGGQDFVEDVDDTAVDVLSHGIVQLEDLVIELQDKYQQLTTIVNEEDTNKRLLEPLLLLSRKENLTTTTTSSNEDNKDETIESNVENDEKPTEGEKDTGDDAAKDGTVHEENPSSSAPPTTTTSEPTKQLDDNDRVELERIQSVLGQLTFQRQRVLYDIGRLLTQIAPLQDTVETQRRQLNYVRSDISTDKTVCEVSGNFMSARDADERIAAHYAGKQYVGWKLVRDKLKSMIQQYGPYGPRPPRSNPDAPSSSSSSGNRPPPSSYGGGGGGGRRSGGGGGGGRYDGGGGGGYNRGGGGPPNRGGGGPPPGRWERGGGYSDRGRGPPPRGGQWGR